MCTTAHALLRLTALDMYLFMFLIAAADGCMRQAWCSCAAQWHVVAAVLATYVACRT